MSPIQFLGFFFPTGGSVSSSQSSLALPPSLSHVVQPGDASRGFAGGSVPALTVLQLNGTAHHLSKATELDFISPKLNSRALENL